MREGERFSSQGRQQQAQYALICVRDLLIGERTYSSSECPCIHVLCGVPASVIFQTYRRRRRARATKVARTRANPVASVCAVVGAQQSAWTLINGRSTPLHLDTARCHCRQASPPLHEHLESIQRTGHSSTWVRDCQAQQVTRITSQTVTSRGRCSFTTTTYACAWSVLKATQWPRSTCVRNSTGRVAGLSFAMMTCAAASAWPTNM